MAIPRGHTSFGIPSELVVTSNHHPYRADGASGGYPSALSLFWKSVRASGDYQELARMEEYAELIDATSYDLEDARKALDLVRDRLVAARELAGRDIPASSA
jgi:hypothetical protein